MSTPPSSPWISVKDRLPAITTAYGFIPPGYGFSASVLVYPYDADYPESIIGVYSEYRKRIETRNGGTHDEAYRVGPITHWMPIPAGPPTEGTEAKTR